MPHGPDFGTGIGVPMNGTLSLILVNGALVGHQRGMTINENNDVVDYSSKESRRQRVGYGRYSSTVTFGSLYVPGASGYLALRDASRNGEMIEIIHQVKGDPLQSAHGVITSMSEDYPDQGESLISIDVTVDNGWAPVAP